MLERACLNAALDKHYWRIIFPNGVVDVIDYFVTESDMKTADSLKGSNLRTHEKIRAAIVARLELNKQYKAQIRTMLAVYGLHPIHGSKATYGTVDAIWRAAGDTATDWNFYSKRALLAGVYSSTLLFWLDDKSEGSQATWEFLDRRLGEVGKLNKFMGKLKSAMPKLAS